jgi:hypothetical protein
MRLGGTSDTRFSRTSSPGRGGHVLCPHLLPMLGMTEAAGLREVVVHPGGETYL